MTQYDERPALQALQQIKELEQTLTLLEHNYPTHNVNLAQVCRYHLDAFRKVVGNVELWRYKPVQTERPSSLPNDFKLKDL